MSRWGSLLGDFAALALDRAAHDDEAAAGARDAATDHHQVLLRHQLDHALAEHALGHVAHVTGHLHAELHTTRRHACADRAAVTAVLVGTVRLHVAGEA